MRFPFRFVAVLVAGLSVVAAGCGDDGGGDSGAPQSVIVVTTNILGDVVENLVGDEFEVVTIMPVGADPHGFQASAQQVAQIGDADVLIINGAGFEEGLLDVIEASEADGVPVFEAISAVPTIEFGEGDHDHEGVDPHFFTDPARMATAADAIAEFLIENVDGIDVDSLTASAAAYVDQIETLDGEIEEMLAAVDPDRRVLLTNHEVFGYFADRYGFEVVGTVIPTGSTADGTSAQALADLAELIVDEGVPAIFADTSSSDELVQTLASEVGDIDVVELFSESLGDDDSEGGTYLDMIRTNAQRITAALAG